MCLLHFFSLRTGSAERAGMPVPVFYCLLSLCATARLHQGYSDKQNTILIQYVQECLTRESFLCSYLNPATVLETCWCSLFELQIYSKGPTLSAPCGRSQRQEPEQRTEKYSQHFATFRIVRHWTHWTEFTCMRRLKTLAYISIKGNEVCVASNFVHFAFICKTIWSVIWHSVCQWFGHLSSSTAALWTPRVKTCPVPPMPTPPVLPAPLPM